MKLFDYLPEIFSLMQRNTTKRLGFALLLLVAAAVLFATCTVPQVQNGITAIPTPGKGYPSSYAGVREYGWPAVIVTERFAIEHPPGTPCETRYSALDHTMGRVDITVYEETSSLMTGVTINLAFFATAFCVAAIAWNVLVERRVSRHRLLGVVMCCVVVMGILAYTRSLPRADPYSWPNTTDG